MRIGKQGIINQYKSDMAESDNKPRREEIFSRTVRAGKRTYFFDVKATRSNEYYLVLTESKRRFNNEQGKFYYEKHKVFLYKEDFEKFVRGLREAIEFIETGNKPEEEEEKPQTESGAEQQIGEGEKVEDKPESKAHTDIDFDDLGKEESQEKEDKKENEEGEEEGGKEGEEEKKD